MEQVRQESAMVTAMVPTVMAIAMMSIGVVAVVAAVVAVTVVASVVVVSVDDHGGWHLLVDRDRHGDRDLVDNWLGLVINWLGLRLVISWSWLLGVVLLGWHRLRVTLGVTLGRARWVILRLHVLR